MTEECVVQLGTDNRQIRIILHYRPYAKATDAWDRDAITATVEVNTGEFHGRIQTLIWSHELEYLRRLLMDLYQHVGHPAEARFELREATLSLVFELTKTGHLNVRVKACDMELDPTVLTYLIYADQTFLPIWSSEITRALEQFPKEL